MTMRSVFLMLAVCLCGLAGCQTLGDARAARGTGTSRLFDATDEQVWEVLPKAVNEVDLSIAGIYREDGYLLAERGTSAFSWGERVSVFVEPIDNQTEVEVVSMRVGVFNLTATEFGDDLLDIVEEMLSSLD